ncbi:hypothetical protein ACFQ2M_05620 [Kitasatospora saccharophila]
MTVEEFSKLSLAQQTKILTPLRAIANALGDQGRGKHADTYGSLVIDAPAGSVTLFATDDSKASSLIADAKQEHPEINTGLIKVAKAAHTRTELESARNKILTDIDAKKITFPIYSISLSGDASGLEVTTGKSSASGSGAAALAPNAQTTSADQVKTALGGSVNVNLVEGAPLHTNEWRWNDSAPYVAGDYVGDTSGHRCTTGAAVYNGTGDWILTASHCFPPNDAAWGNSDQDPNHDLRYWSQGNYVGQVTNVNTWWDMEALWTQKSGGQGAVSLEADQPWGRYYPVTSVQYSYKGDWVCQDGVTAYFTGQGVPCGIQVTDDDTTWTPDAPFWWDNTRHTSRGVCGYASGYGADHGDSGALVFTVEGDNRQARGSVSAGSDVHHVCWTETKDYLQAVGVFLSPYV